MTEQTAAARPDGERERQIRERLAKATPGPWSWTRSYELPNDESPTGYARHWALHNPEGTAKGMVTDSHLVLYSAAPKDIGGRPMEQRPDFALIANAPDDIAWLLSLVDDLREQVGRAQEETAAMREALHPFAEFATMWDAKPLRGTADAFYGIHHGTEWEATLKVSDCRKAAKVLGYASAAVARETGE